MMSFRSFAQAPESFLRCILVLSLLALTACSGGGTSAPATGSLAFKAIWPAATEQESSVRATTEAVPDVCTTYGIDTITAVVLDAEGTETGSGNWLCDIEGHRGTIEDLPVDTGYRVVVEGTVGEVTRWRGEANGISIEKNTTTAVDRIIMNSLDHLLTASTSAGGGIEPSGQVAFFTGSEQAFQITADSGYAIADVVVDGSSVGALDIYTFTDIDNDHTIYVSFTPTGTAVTHTIIASAGAGGTIVPAGNIDVVSGNDQTFMLVPAAGDTIVDVIVDGASQGPISSYTFTGVSTDHTISVAFGTTTYTVTATAGAGGSIDPAGAVTVSHGATPTFTISADTGYYLAELLVNGSAVVTQSPFVFDPVVADTNIAASFVRVWHVAADAAAGGGGSTWQGAFRTLAEAIVAASDGDEIWIKAGTYPLSNQASVNKAVEIYGGFEGTEAYRHQRDWEGNQVILDGQTTTRCLYITADARIDGLILQNGAVNSGYANLQGGALFISNCAPTLANCTIRDSSIDGFNSCSGGAAYVDNSSSRFENCVFEGNTLGCEVGSGGALTLNDSNTTLVASRFFNNRITWGIGATGGGIQINGGSAVIEGGDFTQNSVKAEGTSGGAIHASNTDLTISASRFFENGSDASRDSYGGAIYHFGSATAAGSLIENTLFLGNSASPGYAPNNAIGGAIFNRDASPRILNCTFNRNTVTGYLAAQGGAIANVSGNPTITNTILWGNTAQVDDGTTISDGEGFQIYDDATSSSTVTFSAIDQDGYTGGDNLREDPRLDAAGHLRPESPCRDQGDDSAAPQTDIDGDTRPANGSSDIGADEFIDGDNDALPDYWEALYGLDTGADDGGEDLDSDGLTNLYEYQYDLDPTVANPVADATQLGSYDNSGEHDATDDATRCGMESSVAYRSYLVFDLPAVSGTVVGAILRLDLFSYLSIRSTEAFSVNAVATTPAALEPSGSGQTAIYTDLGDGEAYADGIVVSPAEVGKTVEIPLTAAALIDINDALGGDFAVGLSANTAPGEDDLITFSDASGAGIHQLVLVVE